jgi:hypothetical protein
MILPAHKICYQPIPKNACTSLKAALYRLEAGEEFHSNYLAKSIHNTFPTIRVPPVPDNYFQFAVVRHPRARFLSLIRNRLLYHHDARRFYAKIRIDQIAAAIDQGAVMTQEMFDEFGLRVMRGWKKLNEAAHFNHHALPQMYWIAGRLEELRVYRIEQMAELEQALGQWCNANLKVCHDQNKGTSLREFTLSSELDAFIRTEYDEDYRALEY